MSHMPKWADVILVPVLNLALAFLISGLVIAYLGENPTEALRIMVTGAVGSTYGWSYTLFYATNFMFTGLAVAVAFQAKLFNIGGEGQALVGGLGLTLVVLAVPWPHWSLALAGGLAGGLVFGAAWAAIPAWLQATRGSHIVITTIMFNFIAAALVNWAVVARLRPAGQMDPASPDFPDAAALPTLGDILGPLGLPFSGSGPANISLFVALIAAGLVYVLLWHTRVGYELRAFGESETAVRYAGISPVWITMVTMLVSGALAGGMATNATMGEAERLTLDAVQGAGFIGIAVALIGRSHPIGVIPAALLFGFLTQGGAEIEFETGISRDLVVIVQALVILFTGALDNVVRWPVQRAFAARRRAGAPQRRTEPAE